MCSDDDVRLARRIQRDVVERGRTMEDVLQQYARFVKPSHDDYIAPSKRIADIVIPWHKTDNLVAVDLIVGAHPLPRTLSPKSVPCRNVCNLPGWSSLAAQYANAYCNSLHPRAPKQLSLIHI